MGGKKLRLGISLNKNLLGQGSRKQTTFLRPKGRLGKYLINKTSVTHTFGKYLADNQNNCT